MDSKAHYLKTNNILSTMVAGASGWKAKIGSSDVNAGLMSHLYVFDLPTKWVWMCAVARDAFISMSAVGKAQGEADRNAVRNGLATIIATVSEGKAAPVIADVEWEHQLGGLLATYAGSTKVFDAADGLRDGGHFVVLNYRKTDQTDGLLRPVAMPDSSNQILPVEQLNSSIDQVLAIDRQRHPEWFKFK
jgi:hypothetical protein